MGLEGVMSFFSMLGTLLLLIAVFVGAYFASKLIAKQYQPKNGGDSLEILDRRMVGRDQSLIIVKTAGRVFLLGVTQQSINKIEELGPDYIVNKNTEVRTSPAFLDMLKDAVKDKLPNKPKEGISDEL